jgi:sugar/nucleoside kinase (ribokinase family)
MEVLTQIEVRPAWVALDTMNFWIQGNPEALRRVLAKVDILLVNEAECRALTGERNLVKGFGLIRAMGPKVLVVKRGEYGSLLLTEDGTFACPAFPLSEVLDPTGAGDTFAGGFLGYLAHQKSMDFQTLKKAVIHGTIMSSFTVQGFGLERLQSLRATEIAERLSAFFAMIHVDGI